MHVNTFIVIALFLRSAIQKILITFASPSTGGIAREVAQPGSVHGWGSCGRRFESCLPDKKEKTKAFRLGFFFFPLSAAVALSAKEAALFPGSIVPVIACFLTLRGRIPERFCCMFGE